LLPYGVAKESQPYLLAFRKLIKRSSTSDRTKMCDNLSALF